MNTFLQKWLLERRPVFLAEENYELNRRLSGHSDNEAQFLNVVLHATLDHRNEHGLYVLFVNVEAFSSWEAFLLQILMPHLQRVLSHVGAEADPVAAQLTAREQEVLCWVSEGKSNQEIAAILGISAWTVKVHVGNLLSKLNASTRGHAVAKALSTKLVNVARRTGRDVRTKYSTGHANGTY